MLEEGILLERVEQDYFLLVLHGQTINRVVSVSVLEHHLLNGLLPDICHQGRLLIVVGVVIEPVGLNGLRSGKVTSLPE
jgi:hypothetical protein